MTVVLKLQECMVSNAHPSWFTPMSGDLILRCREQTRGRRYLANLLSRWSTIVNSLSNQELELRLEADPLRDFWLNPELNWDCQIVTRLGAMIYSPSIVRVVSGAQVRLITSALGKDLYVEALRFSQREQVSSEWVDIKDKLESKEQSDLWMSDLKLEGFNALCQFAFARHPLLIERVKVVQAKSLSENLPMHSTKTLLDKESVEECIYTVMKGAAIEKA